MMNAARRTRMTGRRRAVVLLTVCASAVALSNLVPPGATAAPPPTATTVTSVVVSGVPAPEGAPNNPAAVVVADTGFSVTVTYDLPPSYSRDSTVTLTVEPGIEPASEAGNAQFVGQQTLIVPAGEATATASGFKLSEADNRIRIGAEITAGSKDAKAVPKGFSEQFDVVFDAFGSDTAGQTFLNTAGTTTACVPEPDAPYCADLFLPYGSESGSLLTVGQCDTYLRCTDDDQLVVQALAKLGTSYSRADPATLVFRCDKTACSGGGIPSYHLLVNLEATGTLTEAPACSAKGVVDDGLLDGFCVDYRQSKRDNAGDLYLYLLFAEDARMSCC